MRILSITLIMILSLSLISADNMSGNETLNLSNDVNLSNLGFGTLNLSGNIMATGGTISFGERYEGNFTIKTVTIGIEEVPGFIEDALEIRSYVGDFYKYPELNLSTEIVTSKFITSDKFLNNSQCSRFKLGTRAKSIRIHRWWWFDSERIEYYDEIMYICEDKLNEVWF